MVVPTRSRVRIPVGTNFRPWVKKFPRCARRKARPSRAWARVWGFFRGREKPCCFLLMKNGGVRSPLRPRFFLYLKGIVFFLVRAYLDHMMMIISRTS